MGYQEEAAGFLDYNFTNSPFGFRVRDPVSFDDAFIENSVSFLGAAQTVGVWCKYPFPTLVGNALSCNTLNLGYGGAGPALYAHNAKLIEAVNRSKLCVVQVMSGRSVQNRFMEQLDGGATVMLRLPNREPEKMLAHKAYQHLLEHSSIKEIKAVVEESLARFVKEYERLSSLIKVPKVLLWVSSRSPRYKRSFKSYNGLMSTFPHLVDQNTFNSLKPLFDCTVEATSDRYLGMPLWSEDRCTNYEIIRNWGTLTTYGHNYTHPYLHLVASNKLLDAIYSMGIFR